MNGTDFGKAAREHGLTEAVHSHVRGKEMARGMAMVTSYQRLVFAFLAMCWALPACAGFWALPLEAELDLADRVVVGEIIRIDDIQSKRDGRMRIGKATVSVDETLKGTTEKTVAATVVVHLQGGEAWQSPPRSYREGDSGIWVIMPDGRPSHGYGLLDVRRLREVKEHIAMLQKRKWSDAVGGIKVWVGAAKSHAGHVQRQAVMCAVKNVGKETIYLPLSHYSGIVAVVAQHESGKQYKLRGAGDQHEVRREMLCDPLVSGQTRYMHWDGANYGAFLLPKDPPPGAYTVRAVLANDRTTGRTRGRDPRAIQPWTGKVTSEPEVIIVKKPPEQGGPADADKRRR